MASDPQDRLAGALDELRRDVAHVPLASPADVRARGDVRSRHHRVALGAGAALTVAAIALAGSALPGSLRSGGPAPVPPAGGTVTTSPTSPTSPVTPTPSGSPSAAGVPVGPRPVVGVKPVGVGDVPPAYFLPGTLWTGPDLVNGAKVRSIEPKEFEGSVQRFTCDPDASLDGNVAFVQAARTDGTFVGTQKVRLLPDAAAAGAMTTKLASDLTRCQARLREQATRDAGQLAPGETAPNPTADVTEDETARVDDASGSVRLYRTITDYGTGAGSSLIEWVALVREGDAVSLVSINQVEAGDVSFDALQRIAGEVRAQLAWAATRH